MFTDQHISGMVIYSGILHKPIVEVLGEKRRVAWQNMQDGRSNSHKGSNTAGSCTHICIETAQGKCDKAGKMDI